MSPPPKNKAAAPAIVTEKLEFDAAVDSEGGDEVVDDEEADDVDLLPVL